MCMYLVFYFDFVVVLIFLLFIIFLCKFEVKIGKIGRLVNYNKTSQLTIYQ